MKKILNAILIVTILLAGLYILTGCENSNNTRNNEIEIKTNKETIYGMFEDFPESNNIYYTSNSLYSERDIGPTIYQIDILAELNDNIYKIFVDKAEFEEFDNVEIKVNPSNKKYNWKKIKNIDIIKSKHNENATIKSIYLDENTKTIYVIVLGGN